MDTLISTNKNKMSHDGPLTTYTLAQRLCVIRYLAAKVKCGFFNEVWLPRRTYVRQTERTQKFETPSRGKNGFKLHNVETSHLFGGVGSIYVLHFAFCI